MTDDKNNNSNNPQAMSTGVTCTCFGTPSRTVIPESKSFDTAAVSQPRVRRTSIYYVAQEVEGGVVEVEEGDIELEFFDAVQDLEDEDEYPIITTAFCAKSKRVVFSEPETMLRKLQDLATEEEDEAKDKVIVPAVLPPNTPSQPTTRRFSLRKVSSTRKSPKREISRRGSLQFFRRGSLVISEELEVPKINVRERGYPGELTEKELEECQKFYREIHNRKGHYLQIVYALQGIEEEAYAICRFMRAVKYDANAMLERLEKAEQIWKDAKSNGFYEDIDAALGAPMVLFLQNYPNLYYGYAKNGCPVNYWLVGEMRVEGLLSLVPIDLSECYWWHTFMYTFRNKMTHAKGRNPDFVRCESINVMDLKGMSSSQITSEALESLKRVGKISQFFPETMHCMVVINAPSWFALSWGAIKPMLDPRTARKIEIYSSEAKGYKRLAELVDSAELPIEYGGTGLSLEESIRNFGRKPGDKREFHSELIYTRKTDVKKEDLYTLQTGETAKVRVYTRSVIGAEVTILLEGNEVGNKTVQRNDQGEADVPANPFCTEVADIINGPGKLSVVVKGLGDVNPKNSSYGYFLIVVEVDKLGEFSGVV